MRVQPHKPDKLRQARTALRTGLSEAETTLVINYRRLEELVELLRTGNTEKARQIAVLVRDDLGRTGRRLNDRRDYHDPSKTTSRARA